VLVGDAVRCVSPVNCCRIALNAGFGSVYSDSPRCRVFTKGTAYMGILANVFGLGHPIGLAVAPQMVVLAIISLSASARFFGGMVPRNRHKTFSASNSQTSGARLTAPNAG